MVWWVHVDGMVWRGGVVGKWDGVGIEGWRGVVCRGRDGKGGGYM